MKKILMLGLLSIAGFAHADEYVCKVYCNSGETYISVKADSKSDAAAKVDRQSDQICKADNRGNSSSQTMRPEQCNRK